MAGNFPKDLAGEHSIYGSIHFVLPRVTTTAGTATYYPLGNAGDTAPRGFRVVGAYGIMSGNGGVGDTVQVQDGTGNAITEAVSVAVLSSNDKWDASVINRTNAVISRGEGIRVVTASDATSEVYIECVWEDQV